MARHQTKEDHAYYLAHKDKIRVCQNAYQAEHMEQHREANRKYERAHKEERKEINRQWRVALRDFVREQKAGKVCAMCGQDDVTKLVFHHRDPATKLFDICRTKVRSRQTLLEEIAKCDVLCQPCHMRKHAAMRKLHQLAEA